MLTRRSLLLSLPATVLTARFPLAAYPAQSRDRIFVGTAAKESNGIYQAPWNSTTGEIGRIGLAAEVTNPSFLAVQRDHLYVCSEAEERSARAIAYSITPSGLTKLNEQPSLGDATTFISAKNKSVFVANYGGGSVTSFHIQADGSLSKPVSHFQFQGSGPNHDRQEHSHVHSALCSPDGRFLLVNDLGLDRIVIYHVNPLTAELKPNDPPYFSVRAGAGPRHLVWHPNGKWLYNINELDSTVDLLDWNSSAGSLKLRGFVSTLNPDFPKGVAFAGEITISADGRFIYVANRVASDTIAVFSVDASSGALSLQQLASHGGKNTRFCTLDPTGRWMLACNIGSNTLAILARNLETGKLSEAKHTYPLDKPLCLVFA
jgi:6-phosphogluconolactonase